MKKVFIIVCSLVVGILLGLLNPFVINVDEEIPKNKSDTVVKMDTIVCEVPVAKDCMVVKYVTRWLPRIRDSSPETQNTGIDTTALIEDFKRIISTCAGGLPDSCSLVSIPIEQKKYSTDTFTAWISGFEANLDSINIYKRTDMVKNICYIEKKQSRWGVMVGGGAGIDNRARLAPMVGVMVGYKLF